MSNDSKVITMVPYQDIQRMAQAIAHSKLFGVKDQHQVLALMLVAQAEGLHPAIVARDYDIINGKPAKKAEAMLRSFMQAGGSVEWHQLDDTKADATFSHPQGGKIRISWDMDRVKQAEISNQAMYKKYPRQMLRSRCISEGVRTVCPMATSGMYVPEEVQDFDNKNTIQKPAQEPKLVTPAKTETIQEASKVSEEGSFSADPEALPFEGEKAQTAPKPHKAPSEAQLKRLYAITKSKGWDTEEVKEVMRDKFGKISSKDLNWIEYDQLCKFLEANPKQVDQGE